VITTALTVLTDVTTLLPMVALGSIVSEIGLSVPVVIAVELTGTSDPVEVPATLSVPTVVPTELTVVGSETAEVAMVLPAVEVAVPMTEEEVPVGTLPSMTVVPGTPADELVVPDATAGSLEATVGSTDTTTEVEAGPVDDVPGSATDEAAVPATVTEPLAEDAGSTVEAVTPLEAIVSAEAVVAPWTEIETLEVDETEAGSATIVTPDAVLLADVDTTLVSPTMLVLGTTELCRDVVSSELVAGSVEEVNGVVVVVPQGTATLNRLPLAAVTYVWQALALVMVKAGDVVKPVLVTPASAGTPDVVCSISELPVVIETDPVSLGTVDGSVLAIVTIAESVLAVLETTAVLGPHGPMFDIVRRPTTVVVVHSPPNPPPVKPPGPPVVGACPEAGCPDGPFPD
jgi:hypothetical protein